jgi:hypothetical protein
MSNELLMMYDRGGKNMARLPMLPPLCRPFSVQFPGHNKCFESIKRSVSILFGAMQS